LSTMLLTLAIAGVLGLPPEVPGGDVTVSDAPMAQRAREGSQRRISLDAAVAMVRDRFGGRVIRAETQRRDDGATVHVIRLLQDDGRVRIVRVDAETGEIIG